MKFEHRPYVHRHRLSRLGGNGFRVGGAFHFPLLHAPADRQVAVDRVVRRGLIGYQARLDAAFYQLGQNFTAVAEQADRHGLAFGAGVVDHLQGFVERARALVEILRTQTEINTRFIAFDA